MIESVIGVFANFLLPYVVLSAISMLVVELLSALTHERGKVLQRFIRKMLCDPKGQGLARDFYQHHLITSLSARGNPPSYIPTHLFAAVATDLMRRERDSGSGAIPEGLELHGAIDVLRGRWGPGADLAAIGQWFNDVMDGASGFYRLLTNVRLIIVGAIIVVAINFDAIRVSRAIGSSQIVEKMALAKIQTLPADTIARSREMQDVREQLESASRPLIGWTANEAPWLAKIPGFVISTLAVVLLAPFLFDLLNRLTIVRSTVKPAESITPVSVVGVAAPPTRQLQQPE